MRKVIKNITIVLSLLSVGIVTVSSSEDKSVVFGPITYERTTGSPDVFENNFAVSNTDGNFTLYIKNGNGKHRISSAVTTLNGEVIVRQNEFNQKVDFIKKSVKIKPHNVLQVKLNSKPSQTLMLWIEGVVVDILSPTDNASLPVTLPLDGTPVILNTSVNGTIKGQNITTAVLTVNDESFIVPVLNDNFSYNVTLREGLNKIVVKATDSAGNTGSKAIQVFVYNTNIDLKIPLPTPDPFENKKLGAALNYTSYIYETQGIDAALSFISSDPYNIVRVDSIKSRIILKEINQTNLNILASFGINITFIPSEGNELNAWIPIAKIHDLEELEFVEIVYLDRNPVPESITEGDSIVGADKVRKIGFTGLKPDGTPVKISVIDVIFGAPDFHGDKVVDVISSLAPSAQIIKHPIGKWESAIIDARKKSDIIIASLTAPHKRLDGDDSISKEIKIARENGTFYINAAGNYARLHYTGTFKDNDNDGRHEFSTGIWKDETLDIALSKTFDTNVAAYLYLNPRDADKLDIRTGGTKLEDPSLDLLVPVMFNNTSNFVDVGLKEIKIPTIRSISDIYFSVTSATGYNSADVIGTPFHVIVVPDAYRQHRWIDHYNPESSIVAPATSKYAFTVGATYSDLFQDIPVPVSFIPPILVPVTIFSQDELAYFSSQGPVYDAVGNTIIKPDVVAPTFVSTDHGIFGGTSASAPHVAGAAALLLSANPNLTADQLQKVLEESAVDLGSAGKDNKYGAGRIDVYEALRRVMPDLQPSNIQIIRDIATKGQNVIIKVDVRNTGYWDANGVEVQFLINSIILNTSMIPYLKAGNMITVETKWVLENLASYNISVIVDPDNKISEFNEKNNYAATTGDRTNAENIVINEVYYDDILQSTAEWDYEWIELYNPTRAEIDTGGWRIETKSYSGAIRNFTIPSGYQTNISPESYFVIADSENGFFERYSTAPSFVYCKSTNSSLGPGKNPVCLRLHNIGASLSILNKNNELVDRIEWGLGEEGDLKNDNAPDCKPGYSLQRIISGFDSGNSSYDFSCNFPTPFS